MSSITLTVNGAARRLELDDDATPLAYVLRNALGLTGTKVGCALEQCGSCAVLIDGEARLSCVTPAARFAGCDIVTIEGLADSALGRRVQQAFIGAAAAQCGYCSAGIIVALCALLAREPRASRSRVRSALATHICRCGAHPRVLAAVDALVSGG